MRRTFGVGSILQRGHRLPIIQTDYLRRQQQRKGTVMTITTPLNLGQGVFDSAETETLSTAFEKAWAFVEFDPMLALWNASERQAQLARCLMALLKQGETDPTPLANSAIKMLRRNRQSEVRKRRAQTSSAKIDRA